MLILAGCSAKNSGIQGDGGGGSGDGGAMRPPFTNGVSTLAGWSDAGYVDGSRDVNLFHNPVNVAFSGGNIYVADFDNGKIRVVDQHGTASTLISQQNFRRPFGLAFASDGTLWVTTDSDMTGSHTPGVTGSIWRVDVHAKTATIVANAIGMPRGIVPLQDGRLAITDYEHHVVQLVDTSGRVVPLAGTKDMAGFAEGTGAGAKFDSPYGIVQRTDGKLLVCDYGNHRVRIVGLDGQTSTMVGTGSGGFADGPIASAQLNHPQAIAIAANGDEFIADADNFRVRRVSGSTIDTIAGDGMRGYHDDDDRLKAEFYGLEGVSVVPDGSMVYVSDGGRGEDVPFNRVRQIKLK
jgi:hypothetical protein